jgi:hypothetical protein
MSLLVNVAEESQGFLLGVLNLVRKDGEIHPGVGYDETGLLTLSLRTGNKRFYGLLATGFEARTNSDRPRVMTVGAGWGVSVPFWRLFLNTDISAHLVSSTTGLWRDAPNQLSRLRVALGLRAFKHLNPFVGLSANLQHNYGDTDGLVRQDRFETTTFGRQVDTEFWPGVFAGVDF